MQELPSLFSLVSTRKIPAGGAIKGIVRGDVYWGEGEAAGNVAGEMNEAGRYFVLLPRALLAARE